MKRLMVIDKDKWAEWHNILNTWEWPEDLNFMKPKGYDNLPNWCDDDGVLTKEHIIRPLMDLIQSIIGKKETYRWHWLHTLGKTSKEFEEWYARKEGELI